MPSWLDLVTLSTQYSESPERYFWWASLAAVSAITRKNVWLNRFYYKLYPNIYVVLVSKKSGLRKGIPVSLVSKMIKETGLVRVVDGQNSIESIINELSHQKTLESGAVLTDAQAILISAEWDTFLLDNPKGLTILTDLQNTHEHTAGWSKNLKGTGAENLKNPCITLLAASNQALFENVVREKDMEGGFIARAFIVYESRKRNRNPLTREPEGIVTAKILSQGLTEIAKIQGEFNWNNDSRLLYEQWYDKLCDVSESADDRTGTLERLGDQVLKVAMLISLANRQELLLTKVDLEEAISRAEECYAGVRQVSLGSGKSEVALPVGKVLKLLLETPDHMVSRQQLLKKLWPDIDSMVLDRVVETLVQSGGIEALRSKSLGVVYKMPQKVVDEYLKFKGEE